MNEDSTHSLSPASTLLPCRSPLKVFLVKNFLILGFLIGVIIAMLFPPPGAFMYHVIVNGWKLVSTVNMCIIFFIFGITLETSELKQAFKAWKVLLLGLTSILVLTSFAGFIPLAMGFEPPEFGIGLAIFACMPTSLSQGVAVVIQGYGNAALSLLMTVLSNILAIFISPIMVKLVLGSKLPNVQIDVLDLLVKLGVSIIMPLFLGKAIRELVPGAREFCNVRKIPLYLFNNFQIIMIVWMTLSYSQHHLIEQQPYDILFAVIAAIVEHFFFLVCNTIIAFIFRLADAERKAFVISASQKSLPTAAVIIAYLPPNVGEAGLVSIPCIVFYIMQLFIDSFLAKGWASKYERSQQLEEKYKLQLMELDEIEREEAEALALGRQQQQPQHDGGGSAHFAMPPPPLDRAPSFSGLVANGAATANDKSRLLDGVESSNPGMAGR
ncbi:MAG: hypothetical protein WDW38_007127 [Sanguina aurantia]